LVDELAPLGLAACARRLGVSPFELVRAAVSTGDMPSGPLLFDEAFVAKRVAPAKSSGASSKARSGKG
jgi:hypothetical protein